MRYRKLGNTGLIVSELALGTMRFGGKMNMGNLDQEDATRMVKAALDWGINFIDTADVYSLGESETLVGNALKGVRDEIVLRSLGTCCSLGPNPEAAGDFMRVEASPSDTLGRVPRTSL
jgi:aryl-alcohol dehydrogenase-like predicted oxidoreductase